MLPAVKLLQNVDRRFVHAQKAQFCRLASLDSIMACCGIHTCYVYGPSPVPRPFNDNNLTNLPPSIVRERQSEQSQNARCQSELTRCGSTI
jgi:hypothetical protein